MASESKLSRFRQRAVMALGVWLFVPDHVGKELDAISV
jgi:hypothetical protein